MEDEAVVNWESLIEAGVGVVAHYFIQMLGSPREVHWDIHIVPPMLSMYYCLNKFTTVVAIYHHKNDYLQSSFIHNYRHSYLHELSS